MLRNYCYSSVISVLLHWSVAKVSHCGKCGRPDAATELNSQQVNATPDSGLVRKSLGRTTLLCTECASIPSPQIHMLEP